MAGTSIPDSILSNRNIARMNFNFGQVMAHTQTRGSEPINDIYPELEYIGAYSAWQCVVVLSQEKWRFFPVFLTNGWHLRWLSSPVEVDTPRGVFLKLSVP